MGDIAEMVLEGVLCGECGSYIEPFQSGPLKGKHCGFPTLCIDCLEDHEAKQPQHKPFRCQHCKKPFRTKQGLNDHMRVVHGDAR